MNDAPNFPPKHNLIGKCGKIQFPKNQQNFLSIQIDPIFGMHINTFKNYHCTKFRADSFNSVQNFYSENLLESGKCSKVSTFKKSPFYFLEFDRP